VQILVESHQLLLNATLAAFNDSLNQHMPAGIQRDYYLWAFSSQNPYQQEFLQTTGVLQLVNLTVMLLDGLVDSSDWPLLAAYGGLLNVYLSYEAVSDNLAIGIFRTTPGAYHDLQQQVMVAFNQAMAARLKGDPRPAADLLEAIHEDTHRFSTFQQSLSADKHAAFARAYVESHPGVSLKDLEQGLWPALVANIESCVMLANMMNPYLTGSLLRDGLINRYQSVNRTLEAQNMPRLELTTVGAHTILVAPTLAYYAAALAEIVNPNPFYYRVIEDGLLTEALYDAALLVRLLNDMGTDLLCQTDEQRRIFINGLRATYLKNADTLNTLPLLLLSTADVNDTLTRIHKDVFHGEFNVCLFNLRNIQHVPDAITGFGQNLAHFALVYAEHSARLEENLKVIRERLNDDMVANIIQRFVQFHIALYAHRFTTPVGEYAI
jgi:hypothetical protein